MRTLNGHSDQIKALAFSKKSQLISGSRDTSIKVWDIERGQILKSWLGHSNWVLSLAISKIGQLISGSADYKIKFWDIESGQLMKIFNSHKGNSYTLYIHIMFIIYHVK